MTALSLEDLRIASSVPVFDGIKPEVIDRLIAPATALTLKHGQCLYHQGDLAKAAALTGAHHAATAEAISDVRIVRIPSDHLVRCIREMPDIAIAMIASSSRRLQRLVQDIENLKAQTGIQRVAGFLASLCPAGPGPHTITLPYDKTLIAGRLGLQPESLSRAFAKLRKVGVQIHASHVIVNEVSKLKCLAISEGGEFGAALPASLNSDSSLEVSERREE